MKKIKIFLIIILLAAVIYWLWTGSDRFLPYVMRPDANFMPVSAMKIIAFSKKTQI
ncbi:hypothetical protein [Planococcus salinarum]|uniref:hypothetical protein n=1 Tax=Planococcus salinarum TaxID=622695 RepID=UPI0012B68418|nr:hypothetical protein [Planococcus salinarum]